jgi:hypothetical protein
MGKPKNPNVYFDVSIGGAPAERMVFEVRSFFLMICYSIYQFTCIIIISKEMFQLLTFFFLLLECGSHL